ncbi:hypothetical protein OAM19_00140 [bacterium]|nr:hypothetical protein [bacterium]
MIINCKCGKYQFDVKKSEIGTGNREVQCGICNKKWIHGEKSNTKNTLFFKGFFLFIIFLLIVIVTLDYFQNSIVSNMPLLQIYYLAKEQLFSNLVSYLK